MCDVLELGAAFSISERPDHGSINATVLQAYNVY